MKPARVIWRGRRAPTRAELRALEGLPAGTFDAWPASKLEGPIARHVAFHWGNPPRKVARVRHPDYRRGLFELGRLRRVEYETSKGRERAIYVHDFSRPYPLLTGDTAGRLGPILGGVARVEPRGIVR